MSNTKDLTIPASSGAVDQADAVMRLPGGAISMQFGKPEQSHDARFENESVRSGVEDGGHYRTREDGSVEKFGQVVRYDYSTPRDAANPLNSARKPTGFPAHEIGPESIIPIGGMDVPVRAAMHAGYVRHDGHRYVMTEKWEREFGKSLEIR